MSSHIQVLLEQAMLLAVRKSPHSSGSARTAVHTAERNGGELTYGGARVPQDGCRAFVRPVMQDCSHDVHIALVLGRRYCACASIIAWAEIPS